VTDDRPVVLIVDDDASLCRALARLARSVGLRTLAFPSATEFLRSERPDAPSCLLLDVRMPGMNGLDLQAELTAGNIDLPIVFMTGHGDIPMSVRAMKAGAIEFLTKPFRDQDLLDAIHLALERDRLRRDDARRTIGLREQFASLTKREREVMALVVRGLPNKRIAAAIGISEITVKIHRGQVMRKMRATSLPELVRMADGIGIDETRSPAS
jgi:FixJ family two-component response regulator